MLSPHLAKLYGVQTKALLQAAKRNSERFPEDFMFQLSSEEVASLRSQNVTLNKCQEYGFLSTVVKTIQFKSSILNLNEGEGAISAEGRSP